jgi:hypothetical protein
MPDMGYLDGYLLGRGGCWVVVASCPQGGVDECDEGGYFDEWSDDGSEGFA